MKIADVAEILRNNDDYLVVTHKRPDGDTMGSGAALCYALNKIGKTAYLFRNSQFNDCYPWLSAPYLAPEGYQHKFVIAVDLADADLFPKGFSGAVDLCLDHHPSNTGYAKQTFVWADRASCGELILELAKALCGSLDKTIADLLYIAVSTDTGCFCYGNTTGDTHRAAAELCEAGAANTSLNKLLFRTSSKERLLLEGMIFSSLRYYHEGSTVIAVVTLDMLKKAGAGEHDMGDIAALPGRVEGASTSAVIKETEDGYCKVSLRTNGLVNANEVCAKFGGGGHAMASGCVIKTNCIDAAQLLADAIDEASK